MKRLKELREMTQRFAFDNLKKATKAEKSAPKFNLRVDSGVEGKIYYVAVTGKYTDITKWMKTLDEGTVKEGKLKSFKELREKYRSKYPASLVAAAVKIAIDMGGAMTPAVKKIEAMKRGLSNDPIVKDALRMANEEVVNERMSLDRLKKKFKRDIDNYAS